MGWRKPAAIIPRRKAERDLFGHGRYPGGTIPVWAVDRSGRVDFSRPVRRLSEDQALALLRPTLTPPPPLSPSTPAAETSWLAQLATFLFSLIRRT